MSLERAQLKTIIANDIGAMLEDRMEGAKKAAQELSGACQALRQASKKLPVDLTAHIDRSLNEGELKDGMTAVEVTRLVKKYMVRVGDYLSHLADVEQQKAIAQGGWVAGIEESMKIVKDIRDKEADKIKMMIEIASKGDDAILEIRSEASLARKAHGSAAARRAAENSEDEAKEVNEASADRLIIKDNVEVKDKLVSAVEDVASEKLEVVSKHPLERVLDIVNPGRISNGVPL